jgi:hypothetical protein
VIKISFKGDLSNFKNKERDPKISCYSTYAYVATYVCTCVVLYSICTITYIYNSSDDGFLVTNT